MRPGRGAVGLATTVAGAAFLVWYIRRLGVTALTDGLAPVGAWFVLILLLSLFRYAARAGAWIALMPTRVPFARALAATIGGDAVGNVTPLGGLIGEPAKALYLNASAGTSNTLAALAAENFFYGVSIAIYIMLGAAAMLAAFPLPASVQLSGAATFVAMAAGLAAAGWLAWRRPSVLGRLVGSLPFARLRAAAARVRAFEAAAYGSAAAPVSHLARVAHAESLFHLLSFAEAWLTLWLLEGRSLPLQAFVLDAVGRVVNVVFRLVPFRLGVDQAGAGLFARSIGLDPVTGVALSLVRTARLLVWAVVGMWMVARQARRA
jgi:hypothetical protein